MIVDEDPASRQFVAQALAGAGLPYVSVVSPREALLAFRDALPGMVLLGLGYLGADACRIVRQLRARLEPHTAPLVVLASFEADHEIVRVFEAGADDLVRRPFQPVELIARVRVQLRLQRALADHSRGQQRAELVLELTRALASGVDARAALVLAVTRLAEVAQVDRVSVVLTRDHERIAHVVVASDDPKLGDLPIDLAHYPEIQVVLASGAPLVVPEVASHPVTRADRSLGQVAPPFASLCVLPIGSESRPLGVLLFRWRSAVAIGNAEVALGQTVASAMAAAMRSSRWTTTERADASAGPAPSQGPSQHLREHEREAIVAEVAGSVAHELNQPLTSILNYATFLRRVLRENTVVCSSATQGASIIENEAERMARIIRQIGTVTKYETKSYLGSQRILDLERSSAAPDAGTEQAGTDDPNKVAP